MNYFDIDLEHGSCTIRNLLYALTILGFAMLTLVTKEEKDIKSSKDGNNHSRSNVISFTSKARTNEKSQKNVLSAAKKLKW